MGVSAPNLATIRSALAAEDATDGTVRLLFLDSDATVVLTMTTIERANDVDEFFVRYVASMIVDVAAAGVVLTVTRSTGRPTRPDRALWKSLTARLDGAPTELVDLVVVGPDAAWSARNKRAAATGRRSASRASTP